jgi:hypothetical protein
MRTGYDFVHFLRALDNWEAHKSAWLKSLEDARQPAPNEDSIRNYRNCWLEGFLEALINANENK